MALWSACRNFQHSFDGQAGAFEDVFRQLHAWGEVLHAVADFFERIHLHEFALAAPAVVARHPHHVEGRCAEEFLVRTFLLHAMDNARLGHNDELLRGIVLAVGDHFFRRANGVGKFADFAEALGVDHDFGLRITRLGLEHGVAAEFDVGVTIAFPERHRTTGLFDDPLAEVFVGDEEQVFVFGGGIDDLLGVAAGDDDVAQGFHGGAAIDVGDGPEVGVGLLQGFQFFGGATFFQRATGVLVREHDNFVWVENLGRLGHEVNTAEDDDIGAGFLGLLGEAEGIADIIRHVLDFGDLVIVREDDGVELFLERVNLLGQRFKAFLAHAGAHFERFERWQSGCSSIRHGLNLAGRGKVVNQREGEGVGRF